MNWTEYSSAGLDKLGTPSFILGYSTVEQFSAEMLSTLRTRFPGVPVFGATSHLGVFTPQGFRKGSFLLAANPEDCARAVAIVRECNSSNARERAQQAALEIEKRLGAAPMTFLLHPTPGFEERILEGINSAFRKKVPVYGGSAADDDVSGKWLVFEGTQVVREGFLLVGFTSNQPVQGAFLSGFLPALQKGRVTRVEGRRLMEIDRRPAAEVYNEWRRGAIKDQLDGGSVRALTVLNPLGKVIPSSSSRQFLLSHPFDVLPDKSLLTFTEFRVGEEVNLMSTTQGRLVDRVRDTASKLMDKTSFTQVRLHGSILVYCAGCVGAISDQTDEVARAFHAETKGLPFLGAATFGEQGCFPLTDEFNLHGNLMCCAIGL